MHWCITHAVCYRIPEVQIMSPSVMRWCIIVLCRLVIRNLELPHVERCTNASSYVIPLLELPHVERDALMHHRMLSIIFFWHIQVQWTATILNLYSEHSLPSSPSPVVSPRLHAWLEQVSDVSSSWPSEQPKLWAKVSVGCHELQHWREISRRKVAWRRAYAW